RKYAVGRSRGPPEETGASDVSPECGERFPCAFAPALEQAISQHHCVHRTGTGTADAFKPDAAVFQQGIERTPGEGTMCAATLQGEIDGPAGAGAAHRAVQPPSRVIVVPVMLPAPGLHRKRTA